MKVSSTAIVLALATGASAYQQPTRSTLRSLGSKSVSATGPSRNVGSTMKMEGEYYVLSGAKFGSDFIAEGGAVV